MTMGVANLYRSLALGLTLLLVPGLAMAQQAINPTVFQALTAAQKAQQSGDLSKARTALNQALDKVEAGSLELALIQQRLGYVAIAAKQNGQAIDWLRKALAHDQLDAPAARQDQLNLAQLLAVEGQYGEGARLL